MQAHVPNKIDAEFLSRKRSTDDLLQAPIEETAAELRPFDAEAFKSKLMDYATIEAEEPDEER
jgi:hypothetical protein